MLGYWLSELHLLLWTRLDDTTPRRRDSSWLKAMALMDLYERRDVFQDEVESKDPWASPRTQGPAPWRRPVT